MISDERYKQAMEEIGVPDSNSVLAALQRLVNEAESLERDYWENHFRKRMDQSLEYYRVSTADIVEQNNALLKILSDREAIRPRVVVLEKNYGTEYLQKKRDANHG